MNKLCFVALLFLGVTTAAQNNKSIIDSCLQSLSKNNTLVDAALLFKNAPYVGATLEINNNELLVVNPKEFDCTTLVENVLALHLTAKLNGDYNSFIANLQKVRYRNGNINGYSWRLHYASDWIANNVEKGIITEIPTDDKISFHLNFMSTHANKYKYLKNNPDSVTAIRNIETKASGREFYYIPKNKIKVLDKELQHGDIVFFVTSVAGLDMSHVGIVYRHGKYATFIHASSKYKKVIINPEPIYRYCEGIKSNKGIIIVRPVR